MSRRHASPRWDQHEIEIPLMNTPCTVGNPMEEDMVSPATERCISGRLTQPQFQAADTKLLKNCSSLGRVFAPGQYVSIGRSSMGAHRGDTQSRLSVTVT